MKMTQNFQKQNIWPNENDQKLSKTKHLAKLK